MLGLDHSGGLILFASVTKHWRIEIFFFLSSPVFLSISSWLVSQRLSRAVSAGRVTRHTSAPETDLQRLRWQRTEPHRCQTGQRACVSCQTGTHTHTHTHSCTHSCILWCFDSGLWVEIYDPIFIVAIKFQAGQSGGKTVRMIQEDKCFRLKRGCDRMKMCPCVWCLRLWWSFRSVIRWICSSPLGCTELEDGITPQEFWAHLKPDLPLQTADPSKVLPFLALLSNTFPIFC